MQIIRKVKAKKVQPGPRTRSRVNAALEIEKEPRKASTVTEKEVTSSYRPPLLKPTCSKMFKQSKNGEAAAGSVAAYLALRERQKKNEAPLTIENVGELNLEETANEEVEEGKLLFIVLNCQLILVVYWSNFFFIFSCSWYIKYELQENQEGQQKWVGFMQGALMKK